MAHLQISRTQIEGKDFTLNFDYDQLRDGKISKLSDDGRIEWFRQRMHYIFLEPIGRLFKGKSPAYRELNSSKQTDLPARSFVIASFSVLLNGIEALGSFLTSSRKNDVRFCTFIAKYMSSWDVTVQNSPYSTNDLKKILWKHFRNGIAHGFVSNTALSITKQTRLEAGGGSLLTPDHPAHRKAIWKLVQMLSFGTFAGVLIASSKT